MTIAQPPNLRSPEDTRKEFGAELPPLPLATVPFRPRGLLAELPPPPPGKTGWPWTYESPPVSSSPLKISVVTPSFRHVQYLEETIRSVLLQNYAHTEFILMDGGSDDGTAALIEKYRPWLSFARSRRDRGQGHAINLGFSLASGDLMGWMNSDDFYLPGAFARVAAAFRDPQLEFLHGDGLYLIQETGELRYCGGTLALDRYLQFGGLIMSHTAFWRRAVHAPIWEDMQCNVDGELWFRLLQGRRRRHLPLPLALNRNQPEAKTLSPRWRAAWKEDDLKIWPLHGYPPAPRSPRRYEFRYLQRWYASWIARRWRTRRQAALEPLHWAVSPP